jgi:hypothetical protein
VKARKARERAGFRLLSLKQRIESGEEGDVKWWDWFADNVKKSRRDAERLMQVAAAEDPEYAIEIERTVAREGMRALRERRRLANKADLSQREVEKDEEVDPDSCTPNSEPESDPEPEPAPEPERAPVASRSTEGSALLRSGRGARAGECSGRGGGRGDHAHRRRGPPAHGPPAGSPDHSARASMPSARHEAARARADLKQNAGGI